MSQFKFQNRIHILKFQKIVGFIFLRFTFLRVGERSSDSYIGRDGFPLFLPEFNFAVTRLIFLCSVHFLC